MKQLIISSIFFVISFALFSTCSKESNPVVTPTEKNENATLEKKKKKWPEVIYDSTYGEIVMDYYAIVPMAGPCGEKTTYGIALHHFEPKAGKKIGVWPYEFNLTNLTNLRTKWGYSGIFVQPDQTQYDLAQSAGFSTSNMMMSIGFTTNYEQYIDAVDNYNAKYYYVGEAVEHSCWGNEDVDQRLYNPSELYQISTYIHSHPNRQGSAFVSDGYKRCSHLDVLSYYVDILMYSSYSNWYQPFLATPCNPNMSWGPPMENAFWEGSSDQRSSWSDMKSRYGNKFKQTWINTSEITEFGALFGHAANLGLSEVWVYGFKQDNGQPTPHYNTQWENISNSAFSAGFLRKFVQDVKVTWKCTSQDPCDCDPSDPDAGWYVYSITPTGSIREIYP